MGTIGDTRGTHAYRALVRRVRSEDRQCWLCGHAIDVTIPYRDPATRLVNADSWTLDHIVPISVRPDLALVRSNCRAAHHKCNSARGNRAPTRPSSTEPLITSRNW